MDFCQTLYEIINELGLLEDPPGDGDDLVMEVVNCLGSLRQQRWELWQTKGGLFDVDGSWKPVIKRCYNAKSWPMLVRIHGMGRDKDPEFLENEALSFKRMLRAILI